MISMKIRTIATVAVTILFVCMSAAPTWAAGSQVLDRELQSEKIANSKIGSGPLRKMVVYLPPGYEGSSKRYPVIYFAANAFESYRSLFDQDNARDLFDAASKSGTIREFILVSPDLTTPVGGSWCVNSPATGNWEDFVVQELVPYMDANFRTLPRRESRGIAGDRLGGYCAIRLAMRHPEIFGSLYALHPVGTGSGLQIMYSRPNWDLMAKAKSIDDLKGDVFSMIFLSIFQAHVPDADKPPLFVDLPARKEDGQLVVDSKLTERLHNSFFLERMIPQYADNLKSLRGFKFDWGRNDLNQDHVYANQAFTHKLDEFGVPHEAEEYRGVFGDRNWGEDGRVYTEVLPFFGRHLVFEEGGSGAGK